MEAASDVERYLRLGCEDRGLARVAEGIGELMENLEVIEFSRDKALSSDEIARLRELAPMYHKLCGQLEEYGIPASLVNQDFRSGNVVAIDGTHLIYDWADSIVGHPFFSATRFLNYVHTGPIDGLDGKGPLITSEARHERIIDAYLEPWTARVPMERLREAFAVARRINAMYVAVRFYIAMQRAEADIGWERAVVGQLRDVLINEDGA